MFSNNKHAQEYILLFTVFFAFMGTSIAFPIFAPLILNHNVHTIIPISWDHNTRSIILGVVICVYPLGQFFGAPIIGRLSDQHGRKPAMVYTLFGAGIGYLISGWCLYSCNLVLLIISRLLTGFLEGNIAVARASMGDISNTSSKHTSFGKISAVATTGSIAGPLVGGILSDPNLIHWFHFYTPFYFSALLLFILALLSIFLFSETLSYSNRTNPIPFKKQYNIIARIDKLGHNSSLRYFLIIWVLIICVTDAFNLFLPAFLVTKWRMGALSIGSFNAMLGIWYIIGSIYLVPFLSTRLKTLDSITIGMFFYGISLILILIPNKSAYLLPIFVLCDLAAAVILVNCFVFVSNLTKKEHQGEVMGVVLGLRTLSGSMIGLFGGGMVAVSASVPILFSITVSFIVLLSMVPFYLMQKER